MKKSTTVRMIVDYCFMVGACGMVGHMLGKAYSKKWETIKEREEITKMDWTSILKEDVSTNEA